MLMIAVEGTTLASHERRWLQHEGVVGIVLFRSNFSDRAQLQRLIGEIRDSSESPLLVTVDQEGGPVQRFTDGFSRLPPLCEMGACFDSDPDRALQLTREHAWLMASEMLAVGIDLSFAPVVDLGLGNRAIGPRALHADPAAVAALTEAYVSGMRSAGMAATLKHFPGHGSVLEDTHHETARDPRPLEQIEALDLRPFRAGIAAGAEAVMMAHVVYPEVDHLAAGYSSRWIRQMLRGSMGFNGAVISDDIGMAAAEGAGDIGDRVHLHLQAGCDIVLACRPPLVPEAIAALDPDDPSSDERLLRIGMLQGAPSAATPDAWDRLLASDRWRNARATLGIHQTA